MSARDDKFLQSASGIKVLHRADGPRTMLTPEVEADARRRIAEGEDPDAVAEELAIDHAAFLEEAGETK